MRRELRNSARGSEATEETKEDKDAESEQEESGDDSNESNESSDDEPDLPNYSVGKDRVRRAHAGNKMDLLLKNADQEDEFYNKIFGNLADAADDPEYHSESDNDEVDSDFDRSEHEDEAAGNNEEELDEQKKKSTKSVLPGEKDFEKKKKWILARVSGHTVVANEVNSETQAQRLIEAKETERLNIASLQKYEQYELERKKKRERTNVVRKIAPPYVSIVDGPRGKWMVVPKIKEYVKPERKARLLCCVTAQPAKYRDPITGLPYADAEAFKTIRRKYIEYLSSFKNDAEVARWFEENALRTASILSPETSKCSS